MILYLHGFRSGPASYKARLLAEAMRERGLLAQWMCPQLPASPREAAALALSLAEPHGSAITVIGSSLGGYYATWVAERLGCRAVLLNPAVHPTRELAAHVGEHAMYHSDAPFVFRAEYVDELAALAVDRITRPERYFLVAATGDEVLDFRDMVAFYPGARQRIIEGGDHAISGFARWMPEVLAFAGVRERAS
ncbi:esterase [Verticiella sediminum]|uniref:Esterase n=1 Tax=Verticiella sediminum TaxID=1247510 RepID=A0A556A7T9_9BURK|nr:YqiA/YcfP family alpha/beta fold hydrolase [Verticiella sediminum]TSH88958.1 esterase [Verticiella sediminum]